MAKIYMVKDALRVAHECVQTISASLEDALCELEQSGREESDRYDRLSDARDDVEEIDIPSGLDVEEAILHLPLDGPLPPEQADTCVELRLRARAWVRLARKTVGKRDEDFRDELTEALAELGELKLPKVKTCEPI